MNSKAVALSVGSRAATRLTARALEQYCRSMPFMWFLRIWGVNPDGGSGTSMNLARSRTGKSAETPTPNAARAAERREKAKRKVLEDHANLEASCESCSVCLDQIEDPCPDVAKMISRAKLVVQVAQRDIARLSQVRFRARCRVQLLEPCTVIFRASGCRSDDLRLVKRACSLDSLAIEVLSRGVPPGFEDAPDAEDGCPDDRGSVYWQLYRCSRALLVLKQLAWLDRLIGSVRRTRKNEAGADSPHQQDRTRDTSIGAEFCAYCHNPSERFEAAFKRPIGEIVVLAETDAPTLLPKRAGNRKPSARFCTRHRESISNTLAAAGRRAKENGQLEAEFRGMRLLLRHNGLFFPTSRRLHILASSLRCQTGWRELETPRLLLRDPAARQATQDFLRALLQPLLEELRFDLALDRSLQIDDDLIELYVCSDGFIQRSSCDRSVDRLAPADPGDWWATAVARCIERAGAYVGTAGTSDHGYIFLGGRSDPQVELQIINRRGRATSRGLVFFFQSPTWLSRALVASPFHQMRLSENVPT